MKISWHFQFLRKSVIDNSNNNNNNNYKRFNNNTQAAVASILNPLRNAYIGLNDRLQEVGFQIHTVLRTCRRVSIVGTMGQLQITSTGDNFQSATRQLSNSPTTIKTREYKIALWSVLKSPQTMPTAALIITGTMSVASETTMLTTATTLCVKGGPLAEDLSFLLKTCILVNVFQKIMVANSVIFC